MKTLWSLLAVDARYQTLRYRSAIVLYLTILALGSVPGARADIGHYASGLVLHSAAYAVLAFLIYCGSAGSAWTRAWKAVLSVALMGAGDELLQSLFPYRHATVTDWLVDCNAAVLTAAVLWWRWPRADATR